jgi:hypothetical protein
VGRAHGISGKKDNFKTDVLGYERLTITEPMSDERTNPTSEDTTAEGRLDERLWPANVMLVLLALCVAGLIVIYGNFGAVDLKEALRRLAANAWFQLSALFLIVFGLLWKASRGKGDIHIRRLQFSASIGLLLHLAVLTGLNHAELFFPAMKLPEKEPFRRPFEIVSLPSDGRRMTREIIEQGLDQPVQIDDRSESIPVDRQATASPELMPETAPEMPALAPTTQASEIAPPDLSRTEVSAVPPGQRTAAEVSRDQLAGPHPAIEQPIEESPTGRGQPDAQTDGQVATQRRESDMSVGRGGALSFSPEVSPPLLGPDLTRRPIGEPVPTTSSAAAPSPTRAPGQSLGAGAPEMNESPIAPSGAPGTRSLEPAELQVRRETGPLAPAGRGTDRVAGDAGLPRMGTGTQPSPIRRSEGPRTAGTPGRRAGISTPIRRSQIVVPGQPGDGGGIEGGQETDLTRLPGNGGNERGEPGIEPSFQSGGGTRQRSEGLPGRGSVAGLGAGTAGSGSGFGGGGVGGTGIGRGGGTGPARAATGGDSPRPGGGLGSLAVGKSNSSAMPGFVDGDVEGPVPSSLAGSPGGASTGPAGGEGGFSPSPTESGRGFGSSRSLPALPGGLANSSGPGTGGFGPGGLGGDGPGGFGTGGSGSGRARPSNVGLSSPRARVESNVPSGGGGRFILDKSAANLSVDGRPDPAPAYRQRGRTGRGRIAEGLGGNAESEQAVELGLQFLARHQSPDGHWGLHNFGAGRPGYENAGHGSMEADTAGTGLALLAFLGAGYSHFDEPHKQTVSAGLSYLVNNQKPNGDLFTTGSPNVWFYSHGIAAIALCEAYGMTRDEKLRAPAQKAIDFIAAAQNPTLGGWRYSPQTSSDTSVSGWQMMALKSGELAGLRVSPTAYEGVSRWLDSAQARSDPSKYAYRPGSQYAHQREPSRAMTAEALLMRLYLGWDRSTPSLVQGADYLQQNLPQYGRRDNPLRDAYYWYYATQVMFQMQGQHWQAWNDRLRTLLVDGQVQDGPLGGSWDPMGAVPDRWGDAGGRLYVTSMHLLMLEVYYRHLPLYQSLTANTGGQ